MADKTINQLTQATALTDSSLFVIEQNATAKQANWGMMKNYISPGVAAQYSTSATYSVGDYVIYNGSLYRCNTAITTGEAWTAAHWTAAVLGDDVGELKSALSKNPIAQIYSHASFTDGYYVDYSSGVVFSLSTYCVSPLIPCNYGDVFYFAGAATGSQLAYYDTNGDRIDGIAHAGNGYLEIKQNLQTENFDIKYFRWCSEIANKDSILIVDMSNIFKKEHAYEYLLNTDLIDHELAKDGKYVVWNTGHTENYADFSITSFMPVSPSDTLLIVGGVSGSQTAFYDSNYDYIDGIQHAEGPILNVPDDSSIAYFRWCTSKTKMPSAQIQKISRHLVLNEDMVNKDAMSDGYYVSWNDGIVRPLNTYTTTDYIRVMPGLRLSFGVVSAGSQIAFYDKDFSPLTDMGVNMSDDATEVIVPFDKRIKYMKFCCELSSKSDASIVGFEIVTNADKYYEITESVGLLAGLKDAYSNGYSKVKVLAGDYDIINEYLDYYGSTYFSSYTSDYNGSVNGVWDRGVWLDDIEILFESGAKVVANYTVDEGEEENIYVKKYFSAFALGSNVTIDGLVLTATNLRYGIHPDFHPVTYEHVTFMNCDLEAVNSFGGDGSRAIGCGLGIHSSWLFENCIFRAATTDGVLSIHNHISQDAKSLVTIKNCYIYGNGYFRIAYYGASTDVSNVIITGCSYAESPRLVQESTAFNIVNMAIIDWGNVLRN